MSRTLVNLLAEKPIAVLGLLLCLSVIIWWWLAVYRLAAKDKSDALTGLASL
jgi:hypothetical protein